MPIFLTAIKLSDLDFFILPRKHYFLLGGRTNIIFGLFLDN